LVPAVSCDQAPSAVTETRGKRKRKRWEEGRGLPCRSLRRPRQTRPIWASAAKGRGRKRERKMNNVEVLVCFHSCSNRGEWAGERGRGRGKERGKAGKDQGARPFWRFVQNRGHYPTVPYTSPCRPKKVTMGGRKKRKEKRSSDQSL